MIKLKPPKFWFKKSYLPFLLLPTSLIYLLLSYLRKTFTKQIKLSQKIICVGNITLGGSGKTQVVKWLADKLTEKKIPFVIVTKAYKGKLRGAKIVSPLDEASVVGDESIILMKHGKVIAAKTLKSSFELIQKLNPKIVILDDGMQNPLIYKDLQITVFDNLKGTGNNFIFPAGFLRQSLKSGLNKTDLIVMIGKKNENSEFILSEATKQFKRDIIFGAQIKLKKNLNKKICYIAFAGIGNPDKFYLTLKEYCLNVIKQISFEDHHNYSINDLDNMLELANKLNCRLITTEKDYVKIPFKYKKLIDYAMVTLNFDNEEKCIDLIYEKIL